jgi:hypothetical protein
MKMSLYGWRMGASAAFECFRRINTNRGVIDEVKIRRVYPLAWDCAPDGIDAASVLGLLLSS